MEYRVVAFIPARSGSRRVPDKNIRSLAGHPLMAYSIRAALDSGIFESVICATDSELYAKIARHYGADVPFLRTADTAGDTSPDVAWVVWILNRLRDRGHEFDAFSILRPTSPFRSSETILRAWKQFRSDRNTDSLRAVKKCGEHPGKMWVIRGQRMLPLLPLTIGDVPWHSSQYASLPTIYTQDASLEMAWSRVPLEKYSISGDTVLPFISQGYEGYDINDLEDWWMAERLLECGLAHLPEITSPPYENIDAGQ